MFDEEIIRHKKLNDLRTAKIDAYPSVSFRTIGVREAMDEFATLEREHKTITVVGRIRAIRHHGGLSFATIEDQSGKMQLAFKRNEVGEAQFEKWKNLFDIGDFLEAGGTFFLTKVGEKTLEVKKFRILSKALLPLPEKWHGLSDVEIRYRKRYLDLIANPEVRDVFKKRSLILGSLRAFMEAAGFMEVETPVLQPIAGGAAARPFVTHHNALDIGLYLRIAPELYLKRLIVGGYEKVYEMARCFRNEGIDHAHNPEFTQLEFYWAYKNYEDIMKFTEEMLATVAQAVSDSYSVEFDKVPISFEPPFGRVTFRDAVLESTGIDINEATDEAALLKAIAKKKLKLETKDVTGYGELLDALYKKYVRPSMIQPTFVTNYPVAMKPLAKALSLDPTKAASFQLLVAGMELVNAYNELNDPLEQEARFSEQEKMKVRGSTEAQAGDADFIEALKYGMPPTVGFGMGLDRLTAILTDSHSLKEVILFPTLRPE